MVEKVIIYKAFDGKEFATEQEAVEYETETRNILDDQYKFFLKGWNGEKLLQKHRLYEEGVWKVTGEDPNCDLGGHHHNPYLGTYEGKLEDVIRIAVGLPGFWQWGSGGDIVRVEIKKV